MADKLTDMALTKKEAKSSMDVATSPSDAPKYEWGTRLNLSTRSLEKLDITDLPKVGSYVMITAYCCVVSISESEEVDGDENRSVGLQIESMSVEPAKPKRGQAIGKGYKKTGKKDADGDED